MAKTTAIVVLTHDHRANTLASQLLVRHLKDMDVHVVVPRGLQERHADTVPVPSAYQGCTLHQTDPDTSVVAILNGLITNSLSDWTHVFRGDLLLAGGWLQSVLAASNRSACAVGPVGLDLTGPQAAEISDEAMAAGFDRAALWHSQHDRGPLLARADVLDARCFAVHAGTWNRIDPFDELLGEGAEQTGDLTWPLRDWIARARQIRTFPIVARKILSGRSGGDRRPNPHRLPRPTDRIAYLDKHRRDEPGPLWACWVVAPQSREQMASLARSVRSVAYAVEGVHVLLQGPPDGFDAGNGPAPKGKGAKAVQTGDGAHERFARWLRSLLPSAVHVAVEIHDPAPAKQHEIRQIESVHRAGGRWRLVLTEVEVLTDASHSRMRRLCAHPNPLVTGYEVQILRCWGSEHLVLDEAPHDALSEVRLHRTNGHRENGGGGRVSNLQIRDLGLLGMEAAALTPHQVRPVPNEQIRIGAHMLTHSGDDLDDVIRQLDHLYGLAVRTVVVGTDAPRSINLVQVCDLYGAGCAHKPMAGADLDLAAARNEALERTGGAVDWHMFVDPDEWWEDPVAGLAAYRDAASRTDRLAWLVTAHNLRDGSSYSTSASIRLWRASFWRQLTEQEQLDEPDGTSIMEKPRFIGRVHEHLAEVPQMQQAMAGRAVAPLPRGQFWNLGLHDPEASAAKLELYEELIRQQLHDTPDSVQHWITLAAHYGHRGQAQEALECLDNACKHSTGTEALGWSSRARLRAQMALQDYIQAMRRMPPDIGGREPLQQIVDYLHARVGVLPPRQPDAPPVPDVWPEYDDRDLMPDPE